MNNVHFVDYFFDLVDLNFELKIESIVEQFEHFFGPFAEYKIECFESIIELKIEVKIVCFNSIFEFFNQKIQIYFTYTLH